ncbi:MAG TPA: hypothetical protein VK668_04225 [Mucilaginibacter sp.]|nr:hypothetical protein [Mucilaginibacter sp.]
MEKILTNLGDYMIAISTFFFGIYVSYYLSVINALGDLKEIRNDKIKKLINKVFQNEKTNQVDLFYLIDDLNKDNKVWLLDTEKSNSVFKLALWIYGIITAIVCLYFLFRSKLLTNNSTDDLNTFDLISIILYTGSLTWASFNFYWDYVYYIEFKKAEKHMKNVVPMNLIVVDKMSNDL